MVVPALDSPVKLHSNYTFTCSTKQTAEECLWYQEPSHFWYVADVVYALPTVYYFCAVIGAFTILHGIQRWRETRFGAFLPRNKVYKKTAALWRGLYGRKLRLGGHYTPTVGVMSLIGVSLVCYAGITLVPQPYYWPEGFKFGHSPPLATRSGWIGLAMLPFLVIFAAKWNLVTVLTGASHECLNIFHQWTAWAMYIASLIHTFQFIVIMIQQGEMVAMWNTSSRYWTGVAALVPQTLLMFLSLGPFRSPFYEFFKKVHFILSILFIVFLFLHCDFIMTSWDYFVALGAIYGFSLLVRWARVFLQNGFHKAESHMIDEDVLQVRIPTTLKWSPGQHYFFRFHLGGLTSLSSHPFTVCSIPEQGEVEILVRVHKGITARLATLSQGKGWAGSVLLDGPYGGVPVNLGVYDHILLMAGGSGGAFILGIARHLAGGGGNVKKMTIVFATRSPNLLSVVEQALLELPQIGIDIELRIHDTARTISEAESPNESPLEEKYEPKLVPINILQGRPNLQNAVNQAVEKASALGGSLGIAVCGHEEFTYDIRKAVSAAQLGIAAGRPGPTEIYLHTETFSW